MTYCSSRVTTGNGYGAEAVAPSTVSEGIVYHGEDSQEEPDGREALEEF